MYHSPSVLTSIAIIGVVDIALVIAILGVKRKKILSVH
jgi:hypothetical protein